MKRYLLTIASLFLLSTVGASAQLALYGQFSAGKLDVPNHSWIYGSTVGAYYAQRYSILRAGVDLRGTFLGNGSSTVLNSGLAGLRVGIKPRVLPFQPYVEGLIGAGHAEYVDTYQGPISATKFEYQLLAGLDLTLFPHLDWRVVEFSYGALPGLDNSLDPKTVSTGIVLRLR